MARRHATYSVLFGGYEALNEQPELAERGSGDFILFTDDPELRSDFWEVRVVAPALPGDPVRSQRLLKIRVGEMLGDYDTTLYVDNTVTLRRPPAEIAAEWLVDPATDFAVALHSFRESLYDEFDELFVLQLDDPARLGEQLEQYAREQHPSLEQRPYWTGLLARRGSDRLDRAMEVWADHILRYSRRDQLSVRYAVDARLAVNAVELDNHESELHSWPTPLRRKVKQGRAYGRGAGILTADLRRAWRELDEAKAKLVRLDELEEQAAEAVTVSEAAHAQALAAEAQAQQSIAEAQQSIAEAQQAQAAANELVATAVGDAQLAQADAMRLQDEARSAIAAADERAAAAESRAAAAERERDGLRAQLAEITGSAAWKLTAPLRQRKPKD